MSNQGGHSTGFDEVWGRIAANAGESFRAQDGHEFTYRIEGDEFHSSEPYHKIHKSDFEHAYQRVPLHGPETLDRTIVKGPAYVWAVLHDQRISKGEW